MAAVSLMSKSIKYYTEMGLSLNITISIVICSYNRSKQLEKVLTSLHQQSLDKNVFEVVVVDNNSTDDSPAVIERCKTFFPHFQALYESQQGLSYARNHGWRAARGRYVAFLDDDAQANVDWCRLVVHAFETVKPAPDSVGGVILPWYDGPVPTWFDDKFETRSWGDVPGFLEGDRARFGFSGSNMAFPRSLLEGFGGFPHDLGMSGRTLRMGEEADLYYRMWKAGRRFWYDPSIVVKHYVPRRNMKIWYRLYRTYRSGQARSHIEGHRFLSPAYRNEFMALLFLGKELVLCLVGLRNRTSREFFDRLCLFSRQVGYLTVIPGKGRFRVG